MIKTERDGGHLEIKVFYGEDYPRMYDSITVSYPEACNLVGALEKYIEDIKQETKEYLK